MLSVTAVVALLLVLMSNSAPPPSETRSTLPSRVLQSDYGNQGQGEQGPPVFPASPRGDDGERAVSRDPDADMSAAIRLEREALRWDAVDPPRTQSLMNAASAKYGSAAQGFSRQGRRAEQLEADQGMVRAIQFVPRPIPNPLETWGG